MTGIKIGILGKNDEKYNSKNDEKYNSKKSK